MNDTSDPGYDFGVPLSKKDKVLLIGLAILAVAFGWGCIWLLARMATAL